MPSRPSAAGTVHVHDDWIGRRLCDSEAFCGARVAYLTRLGEGILPTASTVYQEGDVVHLVVGRQELPVLETRLDQQPPSECAEVRVVVVGAGSVGRSIARELNHNGHEVLLIDRDASEAR